MTELILNEYLPHCLAMGITRAEFGELNITKLRPYILADEISFNRDNQMAHLQGRYFFDALTIAISNALRKSGQQATNYPERPYDFDEMKKKQDEEERKKLQIESMKAQFAKFADGLKTKLGDKDG